MSLDSSRRTFGTFRAGERISLLLVPMCRPFYISGFQGKGARNEKDSHNFFFFSFLLCWPPLGLRISNPLHFSHLINQYGLRTWRKRYNQHTNLSLNVDISFSHNLRFYIGGSRGGRGGAVRGGRGGFGARGGGVQGRGGRGEYQTKMNRSLVFV